MDTPALAEALKTAKRKQQISEQRVATLEASLTRHENLRMHGELIRAIDIPAGGAAANHSYKKVLVQHSGAEREATLREPCLNAGYHVQILRQFVCELEQYSQVLKLNIVTHLRSEMKASWTSLSDVRRVNNASKSNTISAPVCTNGNSFWAAGMLWYAIEVWTCSPTCEEVCAAHDSAESCTSEVHGDFNAAERVANAPVSAPVAPPLRSQEGRQAPSTPEKQPEQSARQGVVHAGMLCERKAHMGTQWRVRNPAKERGEAVTRLKVGLRGQTGNLPNR